MRIILIALLFFTPLTLSIPEYSDMGINWVKTERKEVGEGEIVEIKASISNYGLSHPFAVYFYCDKIDKEHFIGMRSYNSINKYRFPSIKWDTKGFFGKHTIIALLPEDDNKDNNIAKCNITILNLHERKDVLITEVYYNARPNMNNEFICIGAKNDTVLSGCYLTTQPWKRADRQNKIIFPNVKMIKNERIYVTQNGISFKMENGFNATFEYYNSSPLPDMKRVGKFVMSNEGCVVCLKDRYNRTIDVVVYGNARWNEGWDGEGIKNVGKGIVLRRIGFRDTNTSKDWERNFVIGQSDFPPQKLKVKNVVAFCSPDCSYRVVSSVFKKANESIIINTYLFTSIHIAEILNRSNASLRILLDGNVCHGIPLEERYIAYMLARKGEITYMAGREEEGIYKRYRYNHAKYAIIDGKWVVIQSANFVESGLSPDGSYGNREWGILICNESLAKCVSSIFYEDSNPEMQDTMRFNESHFLYGKPFEFQPSHYIRKGEYRARFNPFCDMNGCNVTIILSPDNTENEICSLLEEAKEKILIEQAYIDGMWEDGLNPFIKKLIEKTEEGVDIKVILDYTLNRRMNRDTKEILSEHGIDVVLQRNITIHNKGVIVDCRKVLISSINWNENSVRRNREIGIIIENENIAKYFSSIFWYDWNYTKANVVNGRKITKEIFTSVIFIATFLLIYLGRRGRKW